MKIASRVTALVAVSVVGLLPGSTPAAEAQPSDCTVSLQASAPSPHLVGERVVWTATALTCGTAPVSRFDAGPRAEGTGGRGSEPRRESHRFAVVRDFSLDNSFARAPMQEGTYQVRVTVKGGFDTAQAT